MRVRDDLERWVLYGIAAIHAGLGTIMVVAPGFFFDAIGPFAPRNDHYLRDLATFYVAVAVISAIAAHRAGWRLPVLVLLAVQYGLHTINHVVDVSEADPESVGVSNIVSLGIGTVVFVVLALRVRRARSPAS